MLGTAMGCMGMSYDDFCRLEWDEFSAVWTAWMKERQEDAVTGWQLASWIAAYLIQPHLSKGRRVTPDKLAPFAWKDAKRGGKGKRKSDGSAKLSASEQRERMRKLVERLGDKTI